MTKPKKTEKKRAEAAPQKIKQNLCPRLFGITDPPVCKGPRCMWFSREKEAKYSGCALKRQADHLNSLSFLLRSGAVGNAGTTESEEDLYATD